MVCRWCIDGVQMVIGEKMVRVGLGNFYYKKEKNLCLTRMVFRKNMVHRWYADGTMQRKLFLKTHYLPRLDLAFARALK